MQMRKAIFQFFTALLLIISVTAVKAQDPQRINVVTTAVPFLRISPDARAGGMGETGLATIPDANSGFWNLAKTPFNVSQGDWFNIYSLVKKIRVDGCIPGISCGLL